MNTGVINGCIRLLELEFMTPLHWYICKLHANELNKRHLFETIDGKTSGPNIFKGEIGKCLTSDIHHKLVAVSGKFLHINVLVIKDLCFDQKYLYEICSRIRYLYS